MRDHFDVSVIICTYNRCDILPKALQSVISQDPGGISYEVLVVDNNSTDRTREVCDSFLSQAGTNMRYLFESKQGISHARNAGIASARAPILAFTDDDVYVSKDWVANIKKTFDKHPEVDCVGGKVLPEWESEPPPWLTRDHWTPLALLDYGERPIHIDAKKPICMVGANFAFRRSVFDQVGLFSPKLQRVGDGIGSMEDHELLLRLWGANRQTLYSPEVIVTADVQSERLTKHYHRKWHTGHGHFYALMREKEFERSVARLFDVPAHLYKQALMNAIACVKHTLLNHQDRAFASEVELRFFAGFFRTRRKQFAASSGHGVLRELASFLRSFILAKEPRKAR